MDKLKKIAYNCRKATLLIEKQQFVQLTTTERVELKLHLAGCSVCRIFQQQSITINKMMKEFFNHRTTNSRLNHNFKQSMQEMINKKISE
jgi:ribosomal protein S3AE